MPVVIVPTKYYTTPTDDFRDWGVSLVIWANHNVRSSVQAMKATTQEIFDQKSLLGVEEKIVDVKEIFRLQRTGQLDENAKKYDSWLPSRPVADEQTRDFVRPAHFYAGAATGPLRLDRGAAHTAHRAPAEMRPPTNLHRSPHPWRWPAGFPEREWPCCGCLRPRSGP